jgi:N-acetylmuramoyl-L-alanine amidase
MKKFVIALTALLIASFIFAADGYVNIKYLAAQPGISVDYEWELGQVVINGKAGSAKIMLDYPYITAGSRTIRIDIAPFTDNGQIFISQMASDRIMQAVTEVQAEDTPVAVKVRVIKGSPTPAEKLVLTDIVPTAVPKPAVTKAVKAKPEPTEAPTKEEIKEMPTMESTPDAVRVEEPRKNNARKLVIIDPGHGGNDPGAMGPTGVQEKDIVLAVAKKVKDYLKEYPVDVIVTRPDDKFITLKNRAYIANEKKADLFVSIHCNSSPNSGVSGTRAYIYGRVASSQEAAQAAKYENKEIGVFEFLLNDLRKGAYEYLSIEAAGNIQHDLVKELKLKWEPTERAPFYVLANTNMPSVLVEIAFISNPKEEEKMKTYEFKDRVAYGICKGIEQYMDKIK